MVELTYCVVNTSQRELLLAGLDAIAGERETLPFATEVLVLDNGSRDGSADAARAHPAVDEVVALGERTGKAGNDSELLRRARGRFALLLNEDSELMPGATLALWQALSERPDAALAGARLLRPDGTPQPCAWRFPTPLSALAGAVGAAPALHRAEPRRARHARSTGASRRRCSCAAPRPPRVDYLDPEFFVYSDEVDFARRLRDADWRCLYVPAAIAIHHEQLSTDAAAGPRIVQLARGRDLYMRKHLSAAAASCHPLAHGVDLRRSRCGCLPASGAQPARYVLHATATLHPGRGEGLEEAAARYNAGA